MRSAIAESYDRLIRAALAHKVDFVVLAGDMFDTSKPSFDDHMGFFEGLARLDEAGIPTFLVTGNHDPYTTWAKDLDLFPPSARLLGIDGPEFALFEKDGEPLCLIAGRSYFNQSWPADRDIAEGLTRDAAIQALSAEDPGAGQAPFAIGIIHTGLDFDPNKAPTSEADLLVRGMDYWACGHLHRQLIRPNAADPRIVFPGCIQGRSVKEVGPRGALLVELVSGEVPHLEFVPTASVVLESFEVDVSGCATLDDLVRRIQAQFFQANAQAHCEDMIARVTLCGQTPLYGYLCQPAVLERLRRQLSETYPNFYCDSLTNLTAPATSSMSEPTLEAFSGILRQVAATQRTRTDEMINYVQDELVKRDIIVPAALSRSIEDFEDAAELLALHLLEEGDQ